MNQPSTIAQINPVPEVVELELTAACQLQCTHCLTSSHPGAGHGTMTLDDWTRAIDQAVAAGAKTIQLIGGEPTVSPHWRALIDHVIYEHPAVGIEVYSNLYALNELHWARLTHPRITLATSYYSDVAAEHEQITGKRGSHTRTRGNILEAVRRGIVIRIGIVEVIPGQRVEEARADLIALGIPGRLIRTDRMRAVGRANPTPGTAAPVSELCGQCGDGKLAILPDGTVAPCVLGRGLRAGNLLNEGTTLASIIDGPTWERLMQEIPRKTGRGCTPDDSNDCDPANTEACGPKYFAPTYPTIRLTPTPEG